MPTEHEYKYVISLDFAEKEAATKSLAQRHQEIQQGYLAFSKGMTTRIRSVVEGRNRQWYLTFKQKVANRVIEIESKLDERDGLDLWDVCVGKIKKNRYIIPDKDLDCKWEIDFFKHDGSVYFVLAEIEMKENSPRPHEPHKSFCDFVLYEVPLTDDRFSNKRLGDLNYAKEIYGTVLKELYTTRSAYDKNKKGKE